MVGQQESMQGLHQNQKEERTAVQGRLQQEKKAGGGGQDREGLRPTARSVLYNHNR